MTNSGTLHPDDLLGMREWFEKLNHCVNALDFAAGRKLVTPDFVAFGTFADYFEGADAAESNQWREVWPTIENFKIRVADIKGFTSPDRLFGVGIAFFDSTGYLDDGSAFDRTGRATLSFVRNQVGDPWLANHSHMSLLRGTPETSFRPT